MLTNEAEEAHDGAEDLHNENFDEQVRVGGVGRAGAVRVSREKADRRVVGSALADDEDSEVAVG